LKMGFSPPPGQLRRILLPFRRSGALANQNITPTRLDAQGWVLKQTVLGFEPVSCTIQTLPKLADAEIASAPPVVSKVLQAVYSDGLARVSLFIEPFDAATHQNPGQTSVGLTQTITLRQGEWWITAVGAVPLATLQSFVGSLARTSK
jgi:sigma-E factor negative regulatory protein RseB